MPAGRSRNKARGKVAKKRKSGSSKGKDAVEDPESFNAGESDQDDD